MSDASLDVTNPRYCEGDTATSLPASIVLWSSFNPQLARTTEKMISLEVRSSRGFNVMLAFSELSKHIYPVLLKQLVD
jgi:beta-glucosidase